MGVWHLAGVGTSPGAVTSALAYLKNERQRFKGFKGEIIDSLVLFTSQEVASGMAAVKEYIFNSYMSRGGERMRGNFNVLEVIKEFIDKELKDVMPEKAKCYLCIVNTEDYQNCFENVAKVLLKFSPPGAVGKHIWANLTGGTNILNAAIMHAASLSGSISKVYYIYVPFEDDRKYLQPFTRDENRFRWDEVEIAKTCFDEFYYEILKALEEIGNWIEDEELLNRLKGGRFSHRFSPLQLQDFRQQFLNKMDGIVIERDDNKNRISEYGREVLQRIEDPLFKALIERKEISLTPDLEPDLEELWDK